MKDIILFNDPEAAAQRLLAKFQQDPLFIVKQEFGQLLMKHIDDLTPEERERYDKLKELLTESNDSI